MSRPVVEAHGLVRRFGTATVLAGLDLRGGMERSIEEHEAILAAVRAGDAAEAARLLAEHIHVPQKILEDEGAFELTTR